MPTNNLPFQSTSFVGREKELAEIAALLADPTCRLLTLVGAGGIGKTRLALQAASSQQSRFEDGVVFVPFAPVSSPDLIPAAIADALGIAFFGSGQPRAQLMSYFREKNLLLVMDNFEHLLAGIDLLSDFLQTSLHLKILVTSRSRLNLQEEWVFSLDGLSFPSGSSTDDLESYSAVEMFVQRARQVNSQFVLNDNAAAVHAICRLVEGMPLGLELAATWLRAMSCQQVVEQMARNLDFLTTSLRNVPERHRSLRLVFEQSWHMLSEEEQSVLMKLAVFRGGFDLEASAYVAKASPAILASLVDQSLIHLNKNGRYDIHELLRQYAAEKLALTGEVDSVAQSHLDYFVKFADQAESYLFSSQQILWFDRLEVEFDNLRAALIKAVESEMGLRLAASLGWFFSERAHWLEGFDWLERVIAANPNAPISLLAKAYHNVAALSGLVGQFGEDRRTRGLCETALTLARAANDRWNTAWALTHMAIYGERESAKSVALLEESLALFRELHDSMGITHTLIRLSWHVKSDYAYQLINEAAIYAHEAGDKIMSGWVNNNLGRLSFWAENPDLILAKTYLEDSLSLFREARFKIGFNIAISVLANVEQAMGNLVKAQMRQQECLISYEETLPGNQHLPNILIALAKIACARGQLVRSAKLLGAANRMILDVRADPIQYMSVDNDIMPVRSHLSATVFDEAWAAGNAMSRKQIIAYALDVADLPVRTSSHEQAVDQPLTERELEILHLIADGLNSREIADRLFLTVGTIRWYLRSIYDKLDVHSRSEAIARARDLKILN